MHFAYERSLYPPQSHRPRDDRGTRRVLLASRPRSPVRLLIVDELGYVTVSDRKRAAVRRRRYENAPPSCCKPAICPGMDDGVQRAPHRRALAASPTMNPGDERQTTDSSKVGPASRRPALARGPKAPPTAGRPQPRGGLLVAMPRAGPDYADKLPPSPWYIFAIRLGHIGR